MSSIPPLSEVYDAAIHAVLPSFGTTVVVAGLIAAVCGRRAGYAAAALGFIAGVAAGNFFRGCMVFRFEPESPLSLLHLVQGFWSTMVGPSVLPDGAAANSFSSPAAGRYWLPWAVILATAAGLLTQYVPMPAIMKHLTRLAASAIAARMIVSASLANESPWVTWLIGLSIFLIWTIAERRPARIPNLITSAAAGLASIGAAAVLLHAHSARLSDIGTLVAFASFGIGVISLIFPIEPTGAIPAAAVLLMGVLVAGYHETFSSIPAAGFMLPALGPIAIGLLEVLPERMLNGWRVWLMAGLLAGLPTMAAIMIASRFEPLSF